jgi:hypothetical protein
MALELVASGVFLFSVGMAMGWLLGRRPSATQDRAVAAVASGAASAPAVDACERDSRPESAPPPPALLADQLPAPSPDVAREVETGPALDSTQEVAHRLLREAHETARYLGLEAVTDRREPTVYRLTMVARNELERDALARLAATQPRCLRSIQVARGGMQARVHIDIGVDPPS